MAVTAILMDLRQLALVILLMRIAALMLVAVMAEMLNLRALLVLAIDGRHRPGGLERQRQQHENDQQFFHGLDISIEIRIEKLSRSALTAAAAIASR